MNLGWKFLLSLNRKFFDFKKISFRCFGFSVAIGAFLRDCGLSYLYHKNGTSKNCS